jgi:hypothetical protein
MTLATSAAETITNAHHTADFEYLGNLFGPVAFGTSVIRNAAGGSLMPEIRTTDLSNRLSRRVPVSRTR